MKQKEKQAFENDDYLAPLVVLGVIIGLLGAFQLCQIVGHVGEWAYSKSVAIVAADIEAKRMGGRYVTSCGWNTCTTYWRDER